MIGLQSNGADERTDDSMRSTSSASLSQESDFEAATEQLKRCVLKNDDHPCETVCALYPDLATNRESLLELIYTEHLLRQELGKTVPIKEWLVRFPDLKDHLRDLFQVHEFVGSNFSTDLPRQNFPPQDAWTDLQSVHLHRSGYLGRFELLEQIGRGGMGVVYRARQTDLDRIVAVKTIMGVDAVSPAVRSCFRAEAEAVASLQHPNIVQILEVGIEDDQPYFSMEYVSGGNLASFVHDQPLEPVPAARLVECVARAIHHAHVTGIVHRDIKPANILLAPSDRPEAIELILSRSQSDDSNRKRFEPKVTDFGLAKRVDTEQHNTLNAAPIGTPSYMSPEVAAGDPAGATEISDIYSLGAVLYDILVGRPPFHAATVSETLERVRNDDPVSLRNLQPNVPRDLETICLKCLQKQPSKRYQSALELVDDLDRFLTNQPIRARAVGTGELIYKYCRRHPARFALIVAICMFAVISAWQWQIVAHHLTIALANEKEAVAAKVAEIKEREKFRRTLYTHHVSLALFEHYASNNRRAAQLLEECPTSLRNWEWSYAKQKCEESLREFRVGTMPVRAVAISPDGKTVVGGTGLWGIGRQGELKAWNVADGTLKWTCMAHPCAIMDVEFDSGGKRIVSAGSPFQNPKAEGGVIVRDAETGAVIWSNMKWWSHAATFSPDDRFVAVTHAGGFVTVHDSDTGKETRRWKAHADNINDVAFLPESRILITTGRDGFFRMWDLDQETAIHEMRIGDARRVACSPKGTTFAVASFHGDVMVFQLESGQLSKIHKIELGHAIGGLKFCPNGTTIVASGSDLPIQLLDSATGRRLREIPAHNGYTMDLAISERGKCIASSGQDGSINLWSLDPEKDDRRDSVSGAFFGDIAFLPDSRHVVLASEFNTASPLRTGEPTIRIWDVFTGEVTSTIHGHETWLTSIAVDPRGQWMLSGSHDKTARIWNVNDGSIVHTLREHTSSVIGVAFASNGTLAISAEQAGILRLWNRSDGSLRFQWNKTAAPFHCIASHPTRVLIASADSTGRIDLWREGKASTCRAITDNLVPINQLAFSPDGTLIAAARADSTIALWNVSEIETEKHAFPVAVLEGHTGTTLSLSFSPDGKRLVSSSADRSIKLWDTETNKEVLSIGSVGTVGNKSRVSFSPDGRTIAVIEQNIMHSWTLRR